MKRQTWILAIGGVLILALASGGVGLAMGQRGGFMNGTGLNGAGYGGGMMNGGIPFGGMMQGTGMLNGGQYGGPGGMMGNGTGGMMGGGTGSTATGQAITIDQAQQAVQSALDKLGNQDLVIDEVMEFQDNFYARATEPSSCW
jgi:hypothetical protein